MPPPATHPISITQRQARRRTVSPDFVPLTEPQLAALQLLAQGYWPGQLSVLLGLPHAVVTAVIGAASQSLGARTPEHAVAEALRRGLIV